MPKLIPIPRPVADALLQSIFAQAFQRQQDADLIQRADDLVIELAARLRIPAMPLRA